MMNTNKKLLVAISAAALMAASGVAMAAVSADKQDTNENRPAGEKRFHEKRMHYRDNTALLALLKIDAETFKNEMKAGKSLVTIAKEHGVSEETLKKTMLQQMTQRIEQGVKEGKISAERAEKMKENMEKHVSAMIKGEGPMHKMMIRHKFDNPELLSLLKIDAETLKTERQAGKNLATIAKEHGVSEQKLKDFLVKDMTQRIEQGVKEGKIPAERAEKMKQNMEKNVSAMIKGEGPMHKMMIRHKFDNPELLSLLKIDAETLKTERQAGKNLVTIAKEHGVSEKTLKDFLVKDMTKRLDEGVKSGKIPADKAEKMKTGMEERVTQMINGQGRMLIKR